MIDLSRFASGAACPKPLPFRAPAFSFSPLMAYRLVAGVLMLLVVIHGLALATAINDLLAR
ncbi:MAG TPA: hypothetical protein VH867_02215 [Burkholderiales bacterium]